MKCYDLLRANRIWSKFLGIDRRMSTWVRDSVRMCVCKRENFWKITFAAAFLYRRVASWIRSRTSSSPFPHGTTTRTFPKHTVTFMSIFRFLISVPKKKNKLCFVDFFSLLNCEDLWMTVYESTCHFYIVTKDVEVNGRHEISHNVLLYKFGSPSAQNAHDCANICADGCECDTTRSSYSLRNLNFTIYLSNREVSHSSLN